MTAPLELTNAAQAAEAKHKARASASHTETHLALQYRPDIDGLRALAVAAVVIRDARLGCAGGYVGVDIFFVISGFLITSLMFRATEKSSFHLGDFWERRVRRIAPAMLVSITLILAASWFLLLPTDLALLGRATMAQMLCLSNVFHWKTSGYFAPTVDALPLLHTWSLAVEEQFYIVLPILMLVVTAKRRSWLSPMILLGFAASIAAAKFGASRYADASFYLLPTRAWELLLGSALAIHPGFGASAPRWIREVAGAGGLAAMVAAILFLPQATPYPGAILPCLGAAAFMWANQARVTAGGKLLSWKPVVFVGQISYSFYLLHWPFLMFGFYWFPNELRWTWRVGLAMASFVVAILSWWIVETPIRKKRVLGTRRALFATAALATILLFLCGLMLHRGHGMPSRFSPQIVSYADAGNEPWTPEIDLREARQGEIPIIGGSAGPATCLIWGDSHGMALIPVVDSICRENGVRGYAAMRASTAPLLGFGSMGPYGLRDDCKPFCEAIVNFATEKHVRDVIIAGCWSMYAKRPQFADCLALTTRTLTGRGMRVVIIKDVPMQDRNAPRALMRALAFGGDVTLIGVSEKVHRLANQDADTVIDRMTGPNVVVLDPTPYFQDATGICRAEFDGASMYRDRDHLSIAGALRLKPLLVPSVVADKTPQ